MELDAHKSAVARAYGLASDGYNKPALRFFSQGAESLVDFAGLSPGQRILDIASGTGHAAFYAGTKVGVRGSVVGIDIAEQMVHLANAHARASSLANVHFELMDGEHTSFKDNEFDAVLCSYGVFFIPEMVNGIKEWKRLTKHGCVCSRLERRHSSRNPICLRTALGNSGQLFPTESDLLAGNGWSNCSR